MSTANVCTCGGQVMIYGPFTSETLFTLERGLRVSSRRDPFTTTITYCIDCRQPVGSKVTFMNK